MLCLSAYAAHPQLAAVFADADANGDGRLDTAEFSAALALLKQESE